MAISADSFIKPAQFNCLRLMQFRDLLPAFSPRRARARYSLISLAVREARGVLAAFGGAPLAPVATVVAVGAAGATWGNGARRVEAFVRHRLAATAVPPDPRGVRARLTFRLLWPRTEPLKIVNWKCRLAFAAGETNGAGRIQSVSADRRQLKQFQSSSSFVNMNQREALVPVDWEARARSSVRNPR